MAVRISLLAKELNIGLSALQNMLNALGYKDDFFSHNTKIPDDMAVLVRGLCSNDTDLLKLVGIAANQGVYGYQTIPSLKIVGKIDLDDYNRPRGGAKERKDNNKVY